MCLCVLGNSIIVISLLSAAQCAIRPNYKDRAIARVCTIEILAHMFSRCIYFVVYLYKIQCVLVYEQMVMRMLEVLCKFSANNNQPIFYTVLGGCFSTFPVYPLKCVAYICVSICILLNL